MNGNQSNQLSMLDTLGLLSGILQILNYEMSIEDASNSQILAELHTQDRKYLEKILENQDTILKELNKLTNLIQNDKGELNA